MTLGASSARIRAGGALAWAIFCAATAFAVRAGGSRVLPGTPPETRTLLLFALFVFLGGLAGMFLLTRLAQRRLTRLSDAVEAICATPDFNQRIDETGPAGQRALAAGINAMLDVLQQTREQLTDANTELQTLLAARTREASTTRQALAEDIVRRMESEQIAQKQERIYRSVHELSPSGIMLISEDGRILEVNAASCAILGYTRSELLGRSAIQLAPPEEQENAKDNFARILRGESLNHEVRNIRKNGDICYIQLRERAIPMDDGHRQILVVMDDVTERRANEERLRRSEEHYHTLFNTMSSGVALHDIITDDAGAPVDFVFTDVNPAFCRLLETEKEKLVGRRGFAVFPQMTQEWLARLGRVALTGEPDYAPVVELQGRQFSISIYSPSRRQFATNLVDITERLSLQEQLLQSQKMEVIGRLAGGIAHDFNNLLQAITGFAQLLLESLDESSPFRSDIIEIDKASRRAADLTRQLLAFSRRQVIEPRTISINELIEGLEKMFRRLIGEDIRLILNLTEGIAPIRADPGQMEQVLANIVINARDAMATGGSVTIATRELPRRPGDYPAHDPTSSGFIEIAISDTGHGIPEDIQEQIFEPFFTTKGPARGTGLGLSVVYGIIKQHEGTISVESTEGVGSTFRIVLPAAPRTAGEESGSVPDAAPEPSPVWLGKGQRILLVEDEPGVRDFILSALRQYKYQPFAADTVSAAHDIFKQADAPFDLLFTDMILPDGTGLDLAESLRKQQPNLRILFSSGYMDERSRWSVIQNHGHPFLQKPYSLDHLLQTLHRIFEEPQPT